MVTFIVDRDHLVPPAHIELADQTAMVVMDRDLRFGAREAGSDQQQPDAGLLG